LHVTSEAGAARQPITVIIVTYNSAAVLGRCLESLEKAAPRRGTRVVIVDNGSSDDSVAMARSSSTVSQVVALECNAGFGAGVNAVLRSFDGEWLAVVNPDLTLSPGALDALADVLAAHPEAGLAGPRILRPGGGAERSAGYFPTVSREWSHALFLDRWLGLPGRLHDVRVGIATPEWLTAAAWLLRGDAVRAVGELDERYFMYYEDVDYCTRLKRANWEVLSVSSVEMTHDSGKGSAGSEQLAADGGGRPLLLYLDKFAGGYWRTGAMLALRVGWLLRWMGHGVLHATGRRSSTAPMRRYWRALTGDVGALRIDTHGGGL